MRSFNLFRRKSLAVALCLTVAAVTLLAPAAQADLPVPVPAVDLGYHAVVSGGFVPEGNGLCTGSLSVTTDRPVPYLESVAVLVTIDKCAVVSTDVIGNPAPKMDQYPQGEGRGPQPGDAGPEKPGQSVVSGTAEWSSSVRTSCDEWMNCQTVGGTVTLNMAQQFYYADNDNMQGDGTSATCASTGQYTDPTCQRSVGNQYGSQLDFSGQANAHFTANGATESLTGYATLYTYSGGWGQMSCNYGGTASQDSNQIVCQTN